MRSNITIEYVLNGLLCINYLPVIFGFKIYTYCVINK